MKKLSPVILGVLLFSVVGACVIDDVDDVDDQTQAIKPSGACTETPTAEEATLLSWASAVTYDELRPSIPTDAARQIIKKAPYNCLNELASVPEVGTMTLGSLINLARSRGQISAELYRAYDQDTNTKYDKVVSFTFAERDDTLAFVNGASRAELEQVDGIGPTLSQRLIDNRPFRHLDQVFFGISGIGVDRLTAIRNSAADRQPSESDPVLTQEWMSVWDVDAEFLALIEGELMDYADAYKEQNIIFQDLRVHDELIVYYADGVPYRYDVLYLQMLDPEGGIQLYITLSLDTDYNVIAVDLSV